jgi:hypothetical protein
MQLVDVASQCYDMGNFNTLMEIISGLAHSSVKRLKACARACGRTFFPGLTVVALSCFRVCADGVEGLGRPTPAPIR